MMVVGARRWRCAMMGALAAAAVPATSALAGDAASPYDGMAMYGIGRGSGQLVRYDFDAASLQTVGPVTLGDRMLTGIEASAYIPGDPAAAQRGFQNLFAFWTDPDDGQTRLLYVDAQTGKAAVMSEFDGGRVTGAVAVHLGDAKWRVFAVQTSEGTAGVSAIAGRMNINPNNSGHSEFELTRPDGSTITRDDLHQAAPIDSGGDLYVGDATRIRIRPKANGNSLTLDGQPFDLGNQTYTFTGDMKVRLYNDHPHKNGKAMGKWWIQIISGEATLGDADAAASSRLIRIDHKTGDVTQIMQLDRAYDGLASTDGQTFLATTGNTLHRIDPDAGSETAVSTLWANQVFGLEYCGNALAGFEVTGNELMLLDDATRMSLGAADLGTIVFVPLSQDPATRADGFD